VDGLSVAQNAAQAINSGRRLAGRDDDGHRADAVSRLADRTLLRRGTEEQHSGQSGGDKVSKHGVLLEFSMLTR